MLVKISKLWFEEVATTGNTNLTLSSFATKLFKEGNLYKGNDKVESILEVLSNPETFSAIAEVKLGKSILQKENLEVLKFETRKEALDWLAKCTDGIHYFGPNGSDLYAPFYVSTDGHNFRMIMDAKTHQGTSFSKKYYDCLTLPDFVGDGPFGQLKESEIKKLCTELGFPTEAYIKKEKEEKKEEKKEGKTFLDESPDLGESADEHFEKLLRGLSKEKTPKFKMDPLPEKVWMKKKKESGDHPNRFKRERLHKSNALFINRPDLDLKITLTDDNNLICEKEGKVYATWSKETGVRKPGSSNDWKYADYFVGSRTLSNLTKEESKKLFKFIPPDPGEQLAFDFDASIGMNFFTAASEFLKKGGLTTATCDVCDDEIRVASVPESLDLKCSKCGCSPNCFCECTEEKCVCVDGECLCECATCNGHSKIDDDIVVSSSSRKEALKLAEYILEKRGIKTASTNKEAYSLFENYGETIKCPNCEMDMVKVRLAGGLSAIYCTTCKHADYDGKIKSRVNAGNPSVEKKITLNCLDSGNCEIKK